MGLIIITSNLQVKAQAQPCPAPSAPSGNTPQNCNNQNSPGRLRSGFPQGQEVEVYILPNPPNSNGFTATQIDKMKEAFCAWQSASGENNSGVTFKFVNTLPASGTYQWLISHEQPPNFPGRRAETGTTASDSGGDAQQVVTAIDPRVTSANAIFDVMVHEIGHGMGLDDCLSCGESDSVMAPYNPTQADYWNGVSGRPTSPTPCDNQRLKQENYPPLSGGGEPGNGGGGPQYPSCTPYYWVLYLSWDGGETWQLADVTYAGCW